MSAPTDRTAFAPLTALLEANVASGEDLGAGVAVAVEGELIYEEAAGTTPQGTPFSTDTLVNVFSVTKTMAALTTLTLVDQGVLALDDPIQQYWTSFTDERVLLRHVLSHTSGFAGWAEPVTIDDIYDLEAAEALLAAQSAWWEPGTASGYQAINHGHLLDGVIRGATGTGLADVFRDQIAVGADFHIGVPASELDRCSDLVPAPPSDLDFSAIPRESVFMRTMTNPAFDLGTTSNSRAWREAAMGGVSGHGTAGAIATLQSRVSAGTAWPSSLTEQILVPHNSGKDQVLMAPVPFGIGYAVAAPDLVAALPSGRVLWWTGFGGAIVVNDLDRRATFAYVPNKLARHMFTSPRTDRYVSTAFDCVDDFISTTKENA